MFFSPVPKYKMGLVSYERCLVNSKLVQVLCIQFIKCSRLVSIHIWTLVRRFYFYHVNKVKLDVKVIIHKSLVLLINDINSSKNVKRK